MTTAILILITAVGCLCIGYRCGYRRPRLMWVWRRVLSVVIKPLLRGTGLRLVHQDYIDSEVSDGESKGFTRGLRERRRDHVIEYRELEFAFLCECEALQTGGAPSSWFVKEYGDDITKARQHHITQGK